MTGPCSKLRLSLAWCIVVVGTLVGRTARAQEGSCGPAARAWARHCAAAQQMTVTPVYCVGERATFRLETPGAQALRVELSRRKTGPARAVPVGDFPDWERVPRARRALLDKVRACVAAGIDAAVFKPGKRTAGGGANLHRRGPLPPPGLPWRALAAALLAAGALLLSGHRVRRRRFLALTAAACALGAATFFFRRALFPPAFFHQNGQGPDWIKYALGVPSIYGPGFFQLFGLAAHVHPGRAERAVFLEAGLLAAAEPVCVLLIARASRARPLLAWTLAFAALAAPDLARLADSESYFGVCTALLLLAGAVLASGARAGRVRSWSFTLAVASAGLFIAQAALVHAVCWIPALLVPLVVLTGRGSLRRRGRLLVAAASGIALVVASTTGATLYRQARIQARWGGGAERAVLEVLSDHGMVLGLALVIAILIWRRGRPRRAAIWVVLLPLVAAAGLIVGLTLGSGLPIWIRHGWWALELPAGVALVSALLGSLGGIVRRRHVHQLVAAATALTSTAWFASSWRALHELPTDALEARFVTSWRGTMPQGSSVAYLQRADKSIATMPVYGCCDRRDIVVHELSSRSDETPLVLRRYAALVRGDRPVYYFRSSLCSTPAGSSACAAIERRLQLEPVAHTWLPARPSVPWTHYDGPRVEVGLFRVRDVHL